MPRCRPRTASGKSRIRTCSSSGSGDSPTPCCWRCPSGSCTKTVGAALDRAGRPLPALERLVLPELRQRHAAALVPDGAQPRRPRSEHPQFDPAPGPLDRASLGLLRRLLSVPEPIRFQRGGKRFRIVWCAGCLLFIAAVVALPYRHDRNSFSHPWPCFRNELMVGYREFGLINYWIYEIGCLQGCSDEENSTPHSSSKPPNGGPSAIRWRRSTGKTSSWYSWNRSPTGP